MLIKSVSITANSATFSVYASEVGSLFLTHSLYGESKPIGILDIVQHTYPSGLSYGSYTIKRTVTSNAVVEYVLVFTLNDLKAQTNYNLYLFISSSFGSSEIS